MMMSRQQRKISTRAAALVGVLLIGGSTFSVVCATRQSYVSVGAPALAFTSRRRPSRGRHVKELTAAIRTRGGSQSNKSEGENGEEKSAQDALKGNESDDTATSSEDDTTSSSDAYDDAYDAEEAEIIDSNYGGDPAAATDGDGAPEPTESLAKVMPPEIQSKRSSASDLRTTGVEHHHGGDLSAAAEVFLQAADELEAAIQIFEELPEEEQEPSELAEMVEEAATCRLHEALCFLKEQKYAESIRSCTAVLDDGVQVVPWDDDAADADASTTGADEDEEGTKRAAVIRVTPTGGAGVATASRSSNRPRISAAARARAYHRRAKARLALQDISGATEDAKEAAYLGDRNAVSLYGKILREHSPHSQDNSGGDGGMGASAGSLASMLGGDNPFLSALGSSGDASGSSADMLSSLLGSGAGSANGNGMSPFGGLGALGSLLGSGGTGALSSNGNSGGKSGKRRRNRKGAAGGPMDGLAKSLLKNLAKRMDDDQTQAQICNFCQGANAGQVQMYAGMAGMQLPDATADRIVAVANGVTKRKLKRGVRFLRRGIVAVKIMSKAVKVVQKYKHLLILVLICGWAKSSLLRAIPVDKKAIKQAAKEAAKVAAVKGAEAAAAAVL
mmetsp:Transcript_29402/g.68871  ORF Transcript_29402/g.68871 Transcript_29402/m.68871 type:complete len:618 (+) Transcript_29402:244-2097(+)|eukprot:CAMPEP_0185799966 /NCGR_PEP_ID=MMETSP1322-20130828/616_1 /TAXON_ID=265543 /ORGANISM="Minutocellus polymorphus, Strain RCC2270" /LENGTH=617 /DNA_ID=CAMNT_0028495575 /DNA_START=229 /DNA_END=2082 /DNA_ORIENTATION=+